MIISRNIGAANFQGVKLIPLHLVSFVNDGGSLLHQLIKFVGEKEPRFCQLHSSLMAHKEELIAEMDRCMEENGSKSGFWMLILLMYEGGNAMALEDDRMPVLYAEMDKWNKKLFGEAG